MSVLSLHTPPQDAVTCVRQTFQALQQWEHWPEIALGAQKEYGMSAEEFFRLVPEYQKFLALAAGFRGIGMLSTQVDVLWHVHILNTLRYVTFCERYFGRLIHHLPCSSFALYGCPTADPVLPYAEKCTGDPPPQTCITPPPSTCYEPEGKAVGETEGITWAGREAIRDSILSSGTRFITAYTRAYGAAPSPDIWERLALCTPAEGIIV